MGDCVWHEALFREHSRPVLLGLIAERPGASLAGVASITEQTDCATSRRALLSSQSDLGRSGRLLSDQRTNCWQAL
jgi:hypothetical protein